jgi:hypothetical protein
VRGFEVQPIGCFAKLCRAPDTPVVIMHEDAFAFDYQEDKYRLSGIAIKFAGNLPQRSPLA